MRKWIDAVEKLTEVIFDPSPLSDDTSIQFMKQDYERSIHKLSPIGTIGDLTLVTEHWPLTNTAHIFLVHDGEPYGDLSLFKRGDVHGVGTFYIRPEYRRTGVGFKVYSFLLDNGYSLRSDKEHTVDSRALWAKLAKHYHVTHNGKTVTDTSNYYDGNDSFFIAKKL